MNKFSTQCIINKEIKNNNKKLEFSINNDFSNWQKNARDKLWELLGDMPSKVQPNLKIEYVKTYKEYTMTRFVFTSEEDVDVPGYLLIPNTKKEKYDPVICLQGHSTGMHNSLGRRKYGFFNKRQVTHQDFGIQAVKNGYAAILIEQRGMGERRNNRKYDNGHPDCNHIGKISLLLGRTLVGQRVWDVMRLIDVLDNFLELDLDKLSCMGQSGGGTVAFYAACLDERIRITMPSASICTFDESIISTNHCLCNYIPKIYKYFDMGDLSGLIAPRCYIPVAGEKDEKFRIEGVKKAYETTTKIYKHLKLENNTKLVVGNIAHDFYPQAWKVFNEFIKNL